MAKLLRAFRIEGTSSEGLPHPEDRAPFPPSWRMFNAARPIPGTVTWTGDFFHGVFYAVISPDDPDAEYYERRCIELDGRLLVPIPRDEIVRWCRAFYATEYPNHEIDWEKVNYRDMVMSWINYHREER